MDITSIFTPTKCKVYLLIYTHYWYFVIMEFVKSTRVGVKLLYEGFVYVKSTRVGVKLLYEGFVYVKSTRVGVKLLYEGFVYVKSTRVGVKLLYEGFVYVKSTRVGVKLLYEGFVYVKSTRVGVKLLYEGFVYVKSKTVIWNCVLCFHLFTHNIFWFRDRGGDTCPTPTCEHFSPPPPPCFNSFSNCLCLPINQSPNTQSSSYRPPSTKSLNKQKCIRNKKI